MFSDASSEPIRDCWLALGSTGAADSLRRLPSAWDMLSITESLTDDSESLAESVPLTDS